MTITAPAGFTDELLARVAALDLSEPQRAVQASKNPDDPYYVTSDIPLEYRRFLLLRLTHPELHIPAPPAIDRFWRLHAGKAQQFAADRAALLAGTDLSPDVLTPPAHPDGSPVSGEIRALYDATFPTGCTELWGWPEPELGPRDGTPRLGLVHDRLPAAFDESARADLAAEAAALRAIATRSEGCGPLIERGSVTSGFGRYHWTGDGPILHRLHWSGAAARITSEHLGTTVVPAGGAYNYYGAGDLISVHTDPYGLELVLLTLLDGPVEKLHCHLDLVDTPLAEIVQLGLATNGMPAGATTFDIDDVSLLMSGQRIPHHRAPAERSEDVMLCVQFFAVLVP